MNTITFDPPFALKNQTVVATLNLPRALSSALTWDLSSSDPSVAPVPSTIFVPAGVNAVTFNVPTKPVSSARFVTIVISDRIGGATRADLWIEPLPTFTLTLDSSFISGGQCVRGTVTLAEAAPSGGATFLLEGIGPLGQGPPLFSPPIVTSRIAFIPAGANTGSFGMPSQIVASDISGQIQAKYENTFFSPSLGFATRTANLTVGAGGTLACGLTVVDPVPALLKGPAVTTDTSLLLTQGRPVNGIAADGVTQVVVRIAGAKPGEKLSLSPDGDGAVAGVADTPVFSSTATLQADESGNAFALYRAPIDFAPPGGVDDAQMSRRVGLILQSLDNPGFGLFTDMTVTRPPVILVHGNWSTAANDWQYFTFLQSPPPFQVFRVDYSAVLPQGVIPASNFILTQLQLILADFKTAARTGQNQGCGCDCTCPPIPVTIPVAAVQADLVAYSLGGLVARALTTLPSFANNTNYRVGYVHKLITLDTPHHGSELANALLDPKNSDCRSTFEKFVGPVEQNIADMATNSPVLTQVLGMPNSSGIHLPAAVVASSALGFQQDDANNAFFNSILGTVLCRGLLPPGGYQPFFTTSTNPTGASDLIVSTYSQLATGLGIGGGIPSLSFAGIIHDVNPILYPTGPDVRQSRIGINPSTLEVDRVGVSPPFQSTEAVKQLLNAPIASFRPILP